MTVRLNKTEANGAFPAEVQRSATLGGVIVMESLAYAYAEGADGRLRVSSVTHSRRVGFSTTNIRKAVYTYYGAGD